MKMKHSSARRTPRPTRTGFAPWLPAVWRPSCELRGDKAGHRCPFVTAHSLSTSSSFVSQHDHRIGFRGANRWDQAGDAGDDKEQGRVAGKDEGIVRGDAEEQAAQKAGEHHCPNQSGQNADHHESESESCLKHKLEDVAPLCANGHTDTDLLLPLAHREGDYAVEADGS